MNETLKAILRVLDEGTPELKVAASQILGELTPQDEEVVTALDQHVARGDNTLNRFILQALAQIGSGPAIRALVSRLRDGGGTADLVRHLLSSMGGGVCRALAGSYADEDLELRTQIVQILGHYAEAGAMKILMQASLGTDEALSKEACAFFLARLDEVSEASRKKHRETIYKLVKADKDITPHALAHALTLVAAINVTQSRATLLKYAQSNQPPIVRRAALLGLEKAHLTSTQSDVLLTYLDDADLTHVVQPTLIALSGHSEWSRASVNKLRGLLSSRREDMKLFALRALQSVESEEVAKIHMGQLHSAKADLQEVAIQALGQNAKALGVLLKSLAIERNSDKAATLIKPLLEHKDRIKPAQVRTMSEKCGKLLADGNPLGEAHLGLLLAIRPELATECLVDKATRLRRARKLTEALRILLLLANAGTLAVDGRYQLALARLIKDNDEGRGGVISQTGDATMGFIAGLAREQFPVFERLKKESMLRAEDLLRVGRHFNAGIGPEQRLGADMLLFVAKKHAKAKAGEEARLMIRAEGLA